MLIGDRAKYLGLIFGIAFSSLLIAQQSSIFISLLQRTASFIYEMRDVDVWVMDPTVDNLDIIEPLRDTSLNVVRSVPSVQWAVPLLKQNGIAKPVGGDLNQATVIGLDNASLVGAPRTLVTGELQHIRQPEGIIIDTIGYGLLWPESQGQYTLGKVIELNDRRAVVVGVADVKPTFTTAPIIYAQYNNALKYTNGGRKRMSFVLVKSKDGFSPEQVAKDIEKLTPFRAMTRKDFIDITIQYYLENTGIPVNFGVTVLLGLIVAAVIVGLLLNMFISENIKQFGALKAMGVNNTQLIKIVCLQSLVVLFIGFSLGAGMAAAFFVSTSDVPALKGFYMPWYTLALTASLITVVTFLSSMFSLRRVLKVDPAIVFKG